MHKTQTITLELTLSPIVLLCVVDSEDWGGVGLGHPMNRLLACVSERRPIKGQACGDGVLSCCLSRVGLDPCSMGRRRTKTDHFVRTTPLVFRAQQKLFAKPFVGCSGAMPQNAMPCDATLVPRLH